MKKENNMSEIRNKINKMIESDDVVLFMKGTPDFPQCGFSANVVGILNYFGITFQSYNVLDDIELREGIKTFSDWPTIPQIYIKKEFIGGFDIFKDMLENGEIEDLLNKKEIKFKIKNEN
tara:strand:+ start:35 stop:394 length:360 start_codon:yes stop_codon:yes gene_type:complete